MPQRRTLKQRTRCPKRKPIQTEIQALRELGFIVKDMVCLLNEPHLEEVLAMAGPLREELKRELVKMEPVRKSRPNTSRLEQKKTIQASFYGKLRSQLKEIDQKN